MNVGLHAGAWAWAVHEGSHIPEADWGKLKIAAGYGIKSIKYLLYEGSPTTQFEDIRRLRQECGFDEIVLRLMHAQGTLPGPAEHVERYRQRVQYALDMGFRVCIQPANEPNLEFADTSPVAFTSWFVTVANKLRATFANAEITSPPIAPFAPNSWAWWDGTRACVDVSDSVGVHVYWHGLEDATGPYSLPWWLGQVPGRPIRVLECGCPTGTSAATRASLLPRLYSQLAGEPAVQGFYPFILSAEDVAQHGEHFLTEANLLTLAQLAAGVAPSLPPVQPPPVIPPVVSPDQPIPDIPIGGKAVYRVTVERIS